MREAWSFLAPTVVALAGLAGAPMAYVLYLSLFRWHIFKPGAGRPFVGLTNFTDLLWSAPFLNATQVTLLFTVGAVLLSVAVGLIIALMLHQNLPARGLLRSAFVLPLAMPPVVAGFAWRFMLSEDLGVIGAYLLPALGLPVRTILGDPTLALLAVTVADAWFGIPLAFLILLAGLQAIPDNMIEAGVVDGASGWKQLRFLILPMLRAPLTMAILMRTMFALNNFAVIYTMTSGGPGEATQTWLLLGWKLGFYLFDMGQAAALGVVVGLVTFGFAALLLRVAPEREAAKP